MSGMDSSLSPQLPELILKAWRHYRPTVVSRITVIQTTQGFCWMRDTSAVNVSNAHQTEAR